MTATTPEQSPHITIWWEDLEIGQIKDLGTISPTKEDIITFASQFDPQPFHLNEEAGNASVFGGLSASGWHTCAMAMRLMVTHFLNKTSSLGSPGLDNLKWTKPVYPGDVLRLQQTIMEKRPMGKRPDVGLVRTVWEMFNQHGSKVLHMEGYGMFRRRTPALEACAVEGVEIEKCPQRGQFLPDLQPHSSAMGQKDGEK